MNPYFQFVENNLFALCPPEKPSYETHPNIRYIYTNDNSSIASVLICPHQPRENSITIIYSHGNAEDIGTYFGWADYLANLLDVNIVLYDYAGYGMSTGQPKINCIFKDLYTVYQYVLATIQNQNIILWGRSLGGAPTLDLLAAVSKDKNFSNTILGAIVESTFASGLDLLTSSSSTNFIISSTYEKDTLDHELYMDNEAKLKDIIHPILIIHGTEDKIIPYSHAERIKEVAKKATLCGIEGGDHNDLEGNHYELITAAVGSWMESLKDCKMNTNTANV